MTMSERSVRDRDWCVWISEAGVSLMVIIYDLFQLLINCTSGRVHVNLYLDFSRTYSKK